MPKIMIATPLTAFPVNAVPTSIPGKINEKKLAPNIIPAAMPSIVSSVTAESFFTIKPGAAPSAVDKAPTPPPIRAHFKNCGSTVDCLYSKFIRYKPAIAMIDSRRRIDITGRLLNCARQLIRKAVRVCFMACCIMRFPI